jgi:small subunit ribosomal protein S2
MRNITLEELLEAGCHFGHQVTRQNPKARDFIFEARDNIHIIDLEKTKECLTEAAKFVKELAMNGGSLLILGTKRQAQPILGEEIRKLQATGADNIYWVTKRWIGGTLTNLSEVSKNFRKLKDFEKNLKDDFERAKYTKREIGEWEKERQKLEGFYGGIVSMNKAPDAIFIIDTHNEDLAVREAHAMSVKMVGITDTNSDPTFIDYPIPANDDAVGSLKLIIEYILGAWREGKMEQGKLKVEEKLKAEKEEEKDRKKQEELKVEKKEKKNETEKIKEVKADKKKLVKEKVKKA